jgi:hypothetical protein
MTDTHEIEIWIAMNERGLATAGVDGDECEDDVSNRLTEYYGGTCVRIVKLKVKMAAPAITQAEVTVPDEAGETVIAEAAE